MTKEEFIEKWTIMYQGDNAEDEEIYERIKQLMLSDLESLSQHEAVNSQISLDTEIQVALNEFGKIQGSKEPKKKRF